MGFIFTKHVKLRIEQRELSEDSIKETLRNPDRVLPGLFGRSLAQKRFDSKILEVVYVMKNSNYIETG